MAMREKEWNLVVEKGARVLLSLSVNSVARFAIWGDVVSAVEEGFSLNVDVPLPSYYDAKYFIIPTPGLMFFGTAGVYIAPDGKAVVYPESPLVYAEDAFDGDVPLKPFALPMVCENTTMSLLYLDPTEDGTAIVRALIPLPTYVKKTFCDVNVHVPQEYTIKEMKARLDIIFATEIMFGRNEGVGVYGKLAMDPYDMSFISSAFVPFAGEKATDL